MPVRPTQVGEKKGYHGWLRSSSREDGRFFHHPTRLHLEETVAALEEGADAVAFASGMAAIAAVFELLSPGDHVICSEDLYGGTTRYLNNVSSKNGVAVEFVDTTVTENVKAALRPQTKAIYLETPSNPMMNVTDILAESDEAGIYAISTDGGTQIFITGHSEYDADTLDREYRRDRDAGLPIEIPCNYYPDDDDTKAPVSTWRSSAHMLYSNWLNYFVYQITPYDLALIGGTCPPNTPTCPEDEEQCPYFSADMRQCTLEKQPKKAPGGA